MKDIEVKRISGHANPGGMQQFQTIATAGQVTLNFFGLEAVGGDAVISEITNMDDTSALAYFGAAATAYQNKYCPGNFKSITLTSGKVNIFLNEQ